MLISASELRNKLGSNVLLVIDARSWKEYSAGHIPSAVNLDLFAFHWADTSLNGIEAFNKQMVKLLSNVGVSHDKFVVFYEDISGMLASRGVWLLEYFSHDKVAILDGGMGKWVRAGYELQTESIAYKPGKFDPKINTNVLATYEYVLNNLNNKEVRIIDARSVEEYTGQAVRAVKAGHIPGAINIDWMENIASDGSFKANDDLKKLYENVAMDNEIILYCQGGYRAANNYLALRKLGYRRLRVYLGSWYEWGNKLESPVER
ncbi:MAG: sulfurtransferase [Nitrososphaerales archaeon]